MIRIPEHKADSLTCIYQYILSLVIFPLSLRQSKTSFIDACQIFFFFFFFLLSINLRSQRKWQADQYIP